jgi:hypothetical protein
MPEFRDALVARVDLVAMVIHHACHELRVMRVRESASNRTLKYHVQAWARQLRSHHRGLCKARHTARRPTICSGSCWQCGIVGNKVCQHLLREEP